MRTNKQLLYDRCYYGLERWLISVYGNRKIRRILRNKKTDSGFDQAFKESICPYWEKYGVKPKKYWYRYFYLLTGSTDPRYIPDYILARKILPHFNTSLFVLPLADKNLNSMVMPPVKRPVTVVKYMSGDFRTDDFSLISEEEAVTRCLSGDRYFLKPSRNSSEGHDISVFSGSIGADAVKDIFHTYRNTDFIIQEGIVQHSALSALNSSSVNTIRLITLVFQGKAHILSSILRVGGKGSAVDNIGSGGYQCAILPDGTLDRLAYTHASGEDTFTEKNDNGMSFYGFRVPSYDDICRTAINAAEHTPHLKYIAWDFAVDTDGEPVLVEFNANVPGQNQETCGPTFGDITDDVLREVFHT